MKAAIQKLIVLHSGYLVNNDDSYSLVPFTYELFTAPLLDFLVFEFDSIGKQEVLEEDNYCGKTLLGSLRFLFWRFNQKKIKSV